MTVKDFVKKCAANIDNTKIIEKHIVKQYIPYAEKQAHCENIVRKTMEVKDGDITLFRQNTPARFLFFTLTLIDLYTDIDVDFGKALEEYDALAVNQGMIEAIFAAIPTAELSAFRTLEQMCMDDYMTNNRNLVSFFETKIGSIKMVFDELVKKAEEVELAQP